MFKDMTNKYLRKILIWEIKLWENYKNIREFTSMIKLNKMLSTYLIENPFYNLEEVFDTS